MDNTLCRISPWHKGLRRRYAWEFHFGLIKAYNSQNLIKIFKNVFEKNIRYQMSLSHIAAKKCKWNIKKIDAALARDAELASERLKTHLRKCLSFSLSGM